MIRCGFVPVLSLVTALLLAAPEQPARLHTRAPELTGGPWINTPERKPLRLKDRAGKVTIVEFWTFG